MSMVVFREAPAQLKPTLGDVVTISSALSRTGSSAETLLGAENTDQLKDETQSLDFGLDADTLSRIRLLTAWLYGLLFEEVAEVVGIQHERLRSILHAPRMDCRFDREEATRVESIAAITRCLRSLMSENRIGDWYRVEIPALDGRTPLEAFQAGDVSEVEEVVKSYFDPSYA